MTALSVRNEICQLIQSVAKPNLAERIRSNIAELIDTYTNVDVDRRVRLCSEDIIFVDPVGLPEIRGREAMRRFFEESVQSGWSFTMMLDELTISSNEALMTWIVDIRKEGAGTARLRSTNMMVFDDDALITSWRAIFDGERLDDLSLPRAVARESRASVTEYLTRLAEGRADADEMLGADACWWVSGQWVGSGTFTKKQVEGFGHASRDWFREPLRLRLCRLFADGNTVVAELESDSVFRDGEPYKNNYVMIYEVRDGKITAVREYLDSDLIARALRRMGFEHPALALADQGPY
jgi:ketosteroid isomerase-like protein